MPEITFEDKLPKLHGQQTGKLVSVDNLPFVDLSDDFKSYDSYNAGNPMKLYPFGNSMVLVLTFLGDKLIPFTTVRRGSAASLQRYRAQIGNTFRFIFKVPQAVQEDLKI